MTAANALRCACCETLRPAAEVYEPVPGLGEYRCRDVAGCRRRIAYVGDPVGLVGAAPPPAVTGARCAVCAAVDPPGGVFERSPHVFTCRDRAGCADRSVETQYLTAWSDSSPDRLISAADMWALASSAPPQIPAGRRQLDPEELAALAGQEALGRRSGGTSATTAT